MIVRQSTAAGVAAFRQFLAECRGNPATPFPATLLEDDRFAATVSKAIEVDYQRLVTKADAAAFLAKHLAALPEHEINENAGLWTWLTLFLFDEVCPARSGRRTVKNDCHYVFEPANPRHYYRHLLYISWRVLQVAPQHNRLFLGSSLSTLDKMTTEVMKRLYLTRIPCILEVLDRLYWDETRGKPKAGIVGHRPVKPGDLVHRLPLRIRQLEMTYDLMSVDANLLGDEFQQVGKPKQALAK